MGAANNQNNPEVLVCHVGGAAADGDYPLCYLPKKFVLLGAKLLDQVGIAASDTDYLVLKIKNGSTELASLDTRAAHEGAVTALVAKSFALTSAEQNLAAGSSLSLNYAETVDMGDILLTAAKVQLYGYWL